MSPLGSELHFVHNLTKGLGNKSYLCHTFNLVYRSFISKHARLARLLWLYRSSHENET